MSDLKDVIARCKSVFEKEFYSTEMHLIYDYRSSLDHEHRWDHLPTPEEIAKREPNPCGWASGMEDSMINAGIAMDMYLDEDNPEMARNIYQGMKLCSSISGVPGFVARSVSPRDGRSFYPESSRDQYTHFVYGMLRYWQSAYSTAEEKAEIAKTLTEVAQYCEKYVTEENDYTFPRGDFNPNRSTVCKMWNVAPHEAARLPMCYAAAYAVTGDSHWFERYRKYADDAAEQSLVLGNQIYWAYALLQMACSIVVICEVETDAVLRNKYLQALKQVQEYLYYSLFHAVNASYTADYTLFHGDWRTHYKGTQLPGCHHFIPESNPGYQERNAKIIREISEVLYTNLMMPAGIRTVTPAQKRCFRFVLESFPPEKSTNYSVFYPVVVWNKARKLGIEL